MPPIPDRDFITSIRDQCNAQLGAPPIIPPDPGTGQPPGGGVPPAHDDSLGWTQGNPLLVSQPTKTFLVTPSAEWLARAAENQTQIALGGIPRGAPVAVLTIAGGESSGAGMTAPWVRYTINGVSMDFAGNKQNWTYDPRFPSGFPMPTGDFVVTVTILDDNKQPLGGGYGCAVELQHTP